MFEEQQRLRVEAAIPFWHDGKDPKVGQQLRDHLYRQMEQELAQRVRDGQAWVVQMGEVQKVSGYREVSRYGVFDRTERYALERLMMPVYVHRGQGVYHTYQMDRDWAYPPLGAENVEVGDWSHDRKLNELAGGRKYVFLTEEGQMRGFERTASGWKRVF